MKGDEWQQDGDPASLFFGADTKSDNNGAAVAALWVHALFTGGQQVAPAEQCVTVMCRTERRYWNFIFVTLHVFKSLPLLPDACRISALKLLPFISNLLFFLSCGGDIKNLVFWWKTHLIKNIFNSCVVYCNSLADFSDFLFHWPLEEKKINVLYRTLKQPWILLHKLHPSPAPLLTNPVLFKVWYTPAPHPTPTPNRDLSNYKQKTSRQHIRIILYVKALVFSVATLWTKLKPL